jgi:hypothetical protein
MQNALAAVSLLLIVVISGCAQQTANLSEQDIIDACVQACDNALKTGVSLDEGPCILNPIPNTNWVCDVAHEPRQAVDNIAENQCQAYRNGAAKYFVEVTPECAFIRTG